MKSEKESKSTAPFVTTDNIFEDIGFSPSEALELKVRGEIYRELIRHIRERDLTQTELAKLLGVHQPEVSHLMNGRVSKFSVGKLIQFAAKLDLNASVKVSKSKSLAEPKNATSHSPKRAGTKRVAKAA